MTDLAAIEVFIKERKFTKEGAVGAEGLDVLLRLGKPVKDLKEYVSMLNVITRDSRVMFVGPVFRFHDAKDFPFQSLVAVADTVTLQLKPGVSLDQFKEAFGRVGIEVSTLKNQDQVVMVAVLNNSSYDPFRIAAFFSPYFDPRVTESSLSWVRLEPLAEASISVFPENLSSSHAGVLSIEQVTVEIRVRALPDVEFRPEEVRAETSLIRGWQPEIKGQSVKVLEFFNTEPVVTRKQEGRMIFWRVGLRGRFLRPGDFMFPALSIPLHPRTAGGATKLASVETNQVEIRVAALLPQGAKDVVTPVLGTVPPETVWRRRVTIGGFSVTLLAGGLTLIIAWRTYRASRRQKSSLSVKVPVDGILNNLAARYHSLADGFDKISPKESHDRWFGILHGALGEIRTSMGTAAEIVSPEFERLSRVIEQKQFSPAWNKAVLDETHQLFCRFANEMKLRGDS